jgi:hypothetical protein
MMHKHKHEHERERSRQYIERDTDRKIDTAPKPYQWPERKIVFLDDFGRVVEVKARAGVSYVVHAWTRTDQRAFRIEGIFDSREAADECLLNIEEIPGGMS